MSQEFRNPFRPGAGHMPPYLAGREQEREEFARLLGQETILENLVLTGLRGVGKTVLLETFKPIATSPGQFADRDAVQLALPGSSSRIAMSGGWLWVGTDLSESSSISEERLALRLITDLAVVTSPIVIRVEERRHAGFTEPTEVVRRTLDFAALLEIWNSTPGIASDKLKAVLETVASAIAPLGKRGIVFAYDEAQNLADHSAKGEYPLSLLLDVFQSLQRKGIPFMLALTGLPTLFPKLVEARTFSERMFHVVMLDRLDEAAARDAILRPIDHAQSPIYLSETSVERIYALTRGYPYFIQYVCREVFDVWTQQMNAGGEPEHIPEEAIIRKLDTDFFAGRWARATDRQRDLLAVIARLPNAGAEFTVQEVVTESQRGEAKAFTPSHVSQMFSALSDAGLIYKNRWGRYSLAVPLLDQFIRRQAAA